IGWLCTRNDDFKDSQVVIVTGPNIDLATGLIRRLKKLLEFQLVLTLDDKETEVLKLGHAFNFNHKLRECKALNLYNCDCNVRVSIKDFLSAFYCCCKS